MKSAFAGFAMAVAAFVPFAAAQEAEDEHHEEGFYFVSGTMAVEHPWVRASAAGTDTLMFMEFLNEGAPDTLISAFAELAGSTGIVGLALVGDQISLVPIGPVEIPSGEFEFDPGGLALALNDLGAALTVGAELEVTLVFENAGELEIHALVEAPDATGHSHDH